MNPADSKAYVICIPLNNSSNLWWCARSRSPDAWTFVLGVCTKESTSCGSNFWDNLSFTPDGFFHTRVWPGISWVNLSHQFATALRWFTDSLLGNKSSAFEGSALKWIVHRSPLFRKNPRSNALEARNGGPLSLKLSTMTVAFHCPSSL